MSWSNGREARAHAQARTIDDVGAVAACLVSDAARAMTAHIAYVDGGSQIVG